MSKKEVRARKGIELVSGDEAKALRGYAAVFHSLSEDLGGFREKIDRNAFARTLAGGGDIYALADHDSSRRLARTANESLRVQPDDTGLMVEIDLPDTTLGRDIRTEVETGLLDSMSFGFRVLDDEWAEVGDDEYVRTLRDVELIEVSAVTFPAYSSTTLEAQRELGRFIEMRSKNIAKRGYASRKMRMKVRYALAR